MIKPQIVKNFISDQEIQELNDWTNNNYKKSFFSNVSMGIINTRLSTRFSKDDAFDYPEVSYQIKKRILEYLKTHHSIIKIDQPGYKDGIVNGIGFNGGDIFSHKDPIWFPGSYTLHCNIITQKSLKGGVTYIDDVPYETNPSDLLMYPVSELEHRVDVIKGSVPRILWCFGFSIFKESV